MMQKRYMSIWFSTLLTDWIRIKRPALKDLPLVFSDKAGNRMVITAASKEAASLGIHLGMPLADARAIVPDLEVIENQCHKSKKLLTALGRWCIRYTPLVALEEDQGLILDISGCAHLWGGEKAYLREIVNRLRGIGYQVRASISDTMGTAWAVSRYGRVSPIIKSGEELNALLPLPPMALRISPIASQKLIKLGLKTIGSFISMPRSVLRRRIGEDSMERIEQVLGQKEDFFLPITVPEVYSERLASMEPIRTRKGIEIAIEKLLFQLCTKLQSDGMGLRSALLQSYRIDGQVIKTQIGTNSPSVNTSHLFKLFSLQIDKIEPKMGIELFTMDAVRFDRLDPGQESLWMTEKSMSNQKVIELLDRLAGKLGAQVIQRYLPQPHHWPERSIKKVDSITEPLSLPWRTDRLRPVQLLKVPEPVQVTAPIPDYPPMLFRYQGVTHQVKKADGPERIEREWWLEKGEHRDYYQLEDAEGKRYWLFRSGHYSPEKPSQWFIHGFFA
ncbi:protein ImuB [Pedobacter suwonensis]|uniref:Protein ImuB n=1 Tax=Pedobacter suwonensis TaxID=332999 RepID=A0A1I0TRU2_9SPHI|nr:DNA polymerase Y family protein [Pedobacter suwonensis]SFA54293.1 protein ImuB [Pedobacter suwonensis]